MNSTSPSYREVPAAEPMQPVDAVAVPVKVESCNGIGVPSSENVAPEDDALSFAHDWDRYQQQEKAEKITTHYVVAFSMFFGYMVIFFVFGWNNGSSWRDGVFPLFLLLVAVFSAGLHLKEIYALKMDGHAITSCPITRIIPRQGLYYSYSGQGEEAGWSILIPFIEIENVLITLADKKMSSVTITTKATGDGAEYVQGGVPKFDTCTTSSTTSVHQSNAAAAGAGNTQPHSVAQKTIALTIHGLREPYIFKKKLLEYIAQGGPKQKFENAIDRIDKALSEQTVVDASLTAILLQIRDELKSLNNIV